MTTNKNIKPKLSVIGAGPGDPDLITVKAIKALSSADIVLYDALVNAELLNYVSRDVKRIYVGKRDHRHTYTQEQINSLIVDLAFGYGHVVRLKGGDPFVFGRGQEEILHAESFNIETAYIPGISSSIGVAGLAGIPVTQRGVSESFWVITGTTRKNELSADVWKAAQTNATVVILMGLNKLDEIVNVFKGFGKKDTPVAVIQNGTLLTENIAIGNIDTISEEVNKSGVGSPAIIVVGEVVWNHPKLRDLQTNLSLNGSALPVVSASNKVLLQPILYS